MDNWFKLFIVWFVSVVATTGSLFFSEVMLLPPCVLCWYQRMAMYPLVLILGLALFPLDLKVIRYGIPLTLLGWGTAVYHNLLYYKIIPEHLAPCTKGISCTSIQLEWLGFITIPLLSLIAFTLILFGLVNLRKSYEV